MPDIGKVAVVGGGTMGNGIAHAFAQYGFDVMLIDVDDARCEQARQTIASNLDRQVKKGTLTQAARDTTLARLQTNSSRAAAAGAELIIEAVPENLQLKQQ